MSESPPTAYRDPLSATSGSGTADAAEQQAGKVGQEAKQSGAHVATVAKDQAAGVAQEAGRQAKGLLQAGRGEVGQQVGQQKQRAVSGITAVGDQLSSLASGSPQPGYITDLAKQASERVSGVAQWLEAKEPADLLRDVQRFARRRPGAFLAAAGVVGLVAGRLTRGAAANAHDESPSSAAPARTTASAYPSAVSDPYASPETYAPVTTYPSTLSGTQSTTGGTYS